MVLGIDISQLILTIVVVCLVLWRMSYGMENGLFAEAAGLIAAIAAFFAVVYAAKMVNSVLTIDLGNIITKIGYLVVAFLVYKIMTAISDALRRIKYIPIIGGVDRLLGSVLGIVEAVIIISIVEYITDIEIKNTVLMAFGQLSDYITKNFINK